VKKEYLDFPAGFFLYTDEPRLKDPCIVDNQDIPLFEVFRKICERSVNNRSIGIEYHKTGEVAQFRRFLCNEFGRENIIIFAEVHSRLSPEEEVQNYGQDDAEYYSGNDGEMKTPPFAVHIYVAGQTPDIGNFVDIDYQKPGGQNDDAQHDQHQPYLIPWFHGILQDISCKNSIYHIYTNKSRKAGRNFGEMTIDLL
jgi:hypothetical protein